jgi:hypothetical protein
MILPHRIIEHKDIHIVDYEAKTYVNSYDSMCQCGSKLLFGVDSRFEVQSLMLNVVCLMLNILLSISTRNIIFADAMKHREINKRYKNCDYTPNLVCIGACLLRI